MKRTRRTRRTTNRHEDMRCRCGVAMQKRLSHLWTCDCGDVAVLLDGTRQAQDTLVAALPALVPR